MLSMYKHKKKFLKNENIVYLNTPNAWPSLTSKGVCEKEITRKKIEK